MGDHANDAIDNAMGDVIELHDHRDAGFPTNQDAYERGLINEMGGDEFSDEDFFFPSEGFCLSANVYNGAVPYPNDPGVQCRNCQEGELHWAKTEKGKWWLKNSDGEWHKCIEERKPMETPRRFKTYHHVFTTEDGIKLYADRKVRICDCDGSLHESGMGCDV